MRLPGTLKRDTEFITNVATLMSGKAIATVIALVIVPIVARLFDPTDFGIAAVYLSIIGILASIGALRYDAAIMLPGSDERAIEIMVFSQQITIAFGVLTTVVIALIEVAHVEIQILEMLGPWKWFLPLGGVLMTWVNIREQWLARHKAFARSAMALIVCNSTGGALRIGAGLAAGTSVYGLVIGKLGSMIVRLMMQQAACRGTLREVFQRIDWKKSSEIAKEYSDFPKLDATAELVFVLGNSLPVLLFGVMFSPAVAGFYAMANRLGRLPMAAVFKALFRVFYQKASEIHNRGTSLFRALAKVTAGLALLGTIPTACVWFFGQEILEWLLGDRWSEAGTFLEIMAPWIFFACLISPANAVFKVLRRQDLLFVTHIILTALRVGAFGIAYFFGVGAVETLEYFVLATIAEHAFRIFLAFYAIQRRSAPSVLVKSEP